MTTSDAVPASHPDGASAPAPGLPPAGAAAPTATPPAKPLKGGATHLYAVDVVRFLTVGGVIAVHSTSLTVGSTSRGTLAAGFLLSIAHVTRSVFLFLTAFVLGHRYRGEVVHKKAFWKRRYVLVAVPYVVWSFIYVLADGNLTSPLAVTARFAKDLLDGGARFHLYFLLITFQLYAVFPWVLRWVRKARPWPLLAASAAVEILFTAGTHYWAGAPSVLGLLLRHPGSWLWSYQLYVVAGVLAALHLDEVTEWARRHTRLIVGFSLLSVAVALISYELDMHLLGMAPVKAGEVFQPTVVFEAMAAIGLQYAAGLWVDQRAGNRLRARLTTSSDVSFGVYLAHPLLLQAILAITAAVGVDAALGGLSPALQLLMVVAILVPGVYTLVAMTMVLVRRSPLSLFLAGRKGRLRRLREVAASLPPAARPEAATAPVGAPGSFEPAVPGL